MTSPARAPALALLAALLATPARAAPGERGSVSGEVGVAAGPSSGTTPRTGQLSSSVAFDLALGQGWSIDLDVTATAVAGTEPPDARRFGDRGGDVLVLTGGAAWTPDDHVQLLVRAGVSPRSTLRADATVPTFRNASGRLVQADGSVASTTRSAEAELALAYDTAGRGRWETLVEASARPIFYGVEQQLDAVRARDGTVLSADELRAACATRACSKQLRALLGTVRGEVTQVALGATAVETIARRVDVGLSATWFVYDHDPSQSGFWSLIAAGRRSGDAAVPLAPARWSVRPRVEGLVGPVRLGAWVEHQEYVPGEGHANLVGARVEVRLARAWRAWAGATLERDVDGAGQVSPMTSAFLGARYAF